jgi:hypothetical protein
MKRLWWIGIAGLALGLACWMSAGGAPAKALSPTATPGPLSEGRIATAEELAAAEAEWASSAHAETYDQGMGANTTCARCKSPRNWIADPIAAVAALDCGSCKRIPGEPRPDLEAGAPVAESDWQGITCDICHQPAGDSFLTSIAYWNNELGEYEAVASETELCARCHKEAHGFQVLEEQSESTAHRGWACSACHGPHGERSACTDCHDPYAGAASEDHARHEQVNCTACHDAGELPIWLDSNPTSRYAGTYITYRIAHAARSWPSHNQQRPVACVRCHHPQEGSLGAVAQESSCESCHPNGAVWYWCPSFTRDPSPLLEAP